jgi:dihydroorotase-like cyclic amidohydrolase
MHCDHAFYVGGTHENAVFLGELERLPGCCGIKVFMGASTGSLLVQDDAGIEQVLRHVNRRAAFHSEDEYRLAERRPLARTGDWTSHRRSATRPRPWNRPTAWCASPRRSASASTCCTSPPRRR